MGKVIRRVIAVLLCATAVMLAVLPEGEAEATSTHGDYEYDGATVAKYLGSESEVTLPAWVNRVGKEAFEGYDKMTKLVMPDTVTTVDFGAFSNCRNLQTVNMSESVRTLGSSAFSGCTNLYSVSVPRTVRTIGSGVFAGCPSLSNVPVSSLNENYTSYDGVLYSRDGKKLVQYLAGRPSTTYRMPTAVKEIEEYAFWGANNLAKLSITSGVTKIPEYAFSNCKGLQHVTLPRSVQSIFAYAFEDCDSLSYINIPDSVGYIDDRAFANTRGAKLRFIDKNGNVVKVFNSEDVDKYGSGTGGDTLIKQPEYTDDTQNTSSTAPTDGGSSGTVQPSDASLANGSTTYYEDGTNSSQSFDPTSVTPLDAGDTDDGGTSSSYNGTGEPSTASGQPSQGSSGSDNTLYNDGYYKASDSGTQPWDTKIEYRDFEDNMTDYDLGGGVVLGGTTVLRMSSKVPVKGFDINNAEYEDEYGTTATPDQRVSDSDVIGDVYAGYKGDDADVSIPAGVKKVGNRAFYKNANIRSVTLPTSVSDIGEFAFARSALSDISIPNGTKNIDYAAFYMCPNLASVNIPQSVSSVGLGAFGGTPFLENWKTSDDPFDYLVVGDGVLLAYKGHDKRIMIPQNIKHIGPSVFAKNNSIESVSIPATVQDIGEEAFADCSNLKELMMSEGIRQIDDRAFANSALTAVSIPDSVEGIGLSAFDNGGKLQTVIFKGNNAPSVTFNKSATRLSAKKLRTDAFEGAKSAIVSSTVNLDDGTMFNPKFYGFSGEVYSISSNDDKTLVLERALTKPDASGNVLLDQSVDVAGITYMVNSVKADAFDPYKNWKDNFDVRPASISVNGERSSDLDSLLSNVNNELASQAQPYEQELFEEVEGNAPPALRSNITVSVNGARFPTRGDAYANIPGEDGKYSLNVTEDESAKDAVKAAFMHSTGAYPSDRMVPLSVDLYDKSGTVPIHKLGNSKMEVTLPVPSGMEQDDGIAVAGLDDNGELETLSSEISDGPSGKNVKFVTGHCSTFVIYSRSTYTTISDDTDAASGFLMSGTWQNLNKKVYGPLSPKWFIIIILVAVAGILLVYRPGKKR